MRREVTQDNIYIQTSAVSLRHSTGCIKTIRTRSLPAAQAKQSGTDNRGVLPPESESRSLRR
ncbi:hypothetical protein KP79_PYT08475 [Mizuhopecten yessoensis]|uniref:Uncharacterized protein n=1 Tax=Mizuhopecten yessoensis TaxID=6573 RepID=A0A210QC65_MIZYE|nr:hypothetical protein KP79_PYT08475 [Mizuhopecten yessoensis]